MTNEERAAHARAYTRTGEMIVAIGALRSMTHVRLFLASTEAERRALPDRLQIVILTEADHRRGVLADALYREATHA